MSCNCSAAKPMTDAKVATLNFASIDHLNNQAVEMLKSSSQRASKALSGHNTSDKSLPNGLFQNLHFTNSGDALASNAFAKANEGYVVLKGSIGPMVYEMHIQIVLELEKDEIVVKLEVMKPLPFGPYSWRFKLGGIIKDEDGKIIGVSSVVPFESEIQTASGISLDYWCVLRCGGLEILETLIICLPSLTLSPAAYVLCVTSKCGESAAKIAICIADKCL
jgi:hypothetical protein